MKEFKNKALFNYLDNTNGIWVGKGVDSQNIIEAEDNYRDNVKEGNDTLAKVVNSKIEYIKYMKYVKYE